MKEIVYDDLDKVCRGCLAKNGEMRPLFGSFLDNMLRAVAEIEVIVIDCNHREYVHRSNISFVRSASMTVYLS